MFFVVDITFPPYINNVQKYFKYLQEYDPKNCLLLEALLEGIYQIVKRMSIIPFDLIKISDKTVAK